MAIIALNIFDSELFIYLVFLNWSENRIFDYWLWMKNIKDELQHIILGDEQAGRTSQLKKVQTFLRANAETGIAIEKKQYFKSEEAAALVVFAQEEKLFYDPAIKESYFISEGAEQRVYRLDDLHVIKTNGSIFYESWLDYFNNLLIHNYFFLRRLTSFLALKLLIASYMQL